VRARLLSLAALLAAFAASGAAGQPATTGAAPTPQADGTPTPWLLVFKLNAKVFPTAAPTQPKGCPFGAAKQHSGAISLAYAYATAANPQLRQGSGLAGTSLSDPLGATFSQVWKGSYHYVVWNDQFYQHPQLHCAGKSGDGCNAPWGHAKGLLAWNDAGEGMVLQVTTPDWPGAGSSKAPRQGEGNTLGCIASDNDISVSQHFFALKLTEPDVERVLDALGNASVVTDPTNPQIVNNGGPPAIRAKVSALGVLSANTSVTDVTLSSGVRLISKPSNLKVPPWQLVSAQLGGVDLRVASWWASPPIPTTTAATPVSCWDPSLHKPGAVEIATSGTWNGKSMGMRGIVPDGNHAKIGISQSGAHPYAIFGDMNQQGALSGNCKSSQDYRGGMFFVVEDQQLHDSVQGLLQGCTAPLVPASATAGAATCVVPPKAKAKKK
jgi:hypothetical protein